MLAIVRLFSATYSNPLSLAALARMAALYELVLICDYGPEAGGILPALGHIGVNQ